MVLNHSILVLTFLGTVLIFVTEQVTRIITVLKLIRLRYFACSQCRCRFLKVASDQLWRESFLSEIIMMLKRRIESRNWLEIAWILNSPIDSPTDSPTNSLTHGLHVNLNSTGDSYNKLKKVADSSRSWIYY